MPRQLWKVQRMQSPLSVFAQPQHEMGGDIAYLHRAVLCVSHRRNCHTGSKAHKCFRRETNGRCTAHSSNRLFHYTRGGPGSLCRSLCSACPPRTRSGVPCGQGCRRIPHTGRSRCRCGTWGCSLPLPSDSHSCTVDWQVFPWHPPAPQALWQHACFSHSLVYSQSRWIKPERENTNYLLFLSTKMHRRSKAAQGSALPKAFIKRFVKIAFEILERKRPAPLHWENFWLIWMFFQMIYWPGTYCVSHLHVRAFLLVWKDSPIVAHSCERQVESFCVSQYFQFHLRPQFL